MEMRVASVTAWASTRRAIGYFVLLSTCIAASQTDAACLYQQVICAARDAVFPISGYDPLASGVRIGRNMVVTNRHVAGDKAVVEIKTPKRTLEAWVIPSAFPGDLSLLRVEGLSGKASILPLFAEGVGPNRKTRLYAIGTDITNGDVRVFRPGKWVAGPAEGVLLGRIHTTAEMQPGVSGGALINEKGELVGISVGGGDGHNEAIPASQITLLLELTKSPIATNIHFETNQRFVACEKALETTRKIYQRPIGTQTIDNVHERCLVSGNAGQYLEAGNFLGKTGEFEKAIALHEALVQMVPNSVNGRIALLISLQYGGRVNDMVPHARKLFHLIPDSLKAQRFAIQTGIWTKPILTR